MIDATGNIYNRFIVNDDDELTGLELIKKLQYNQTILNNGLNNKTDLYGNHKGSWQGIPHPVYADPGIAGVVVEQGKIIERLRKARRFPTKFGAYPYWGQRGDGGWTQTIEEIKRQVDVYYETGVEMMATFVHTQLDSSKNVYVSNDLSRFREGILYAQSKGIEFKKIKLDCNEFRQEFLDNPARRNDLFVQWKSIIDEVAEAFGDIIEELIVLNEPDILLADETTHPYIWDWIRYAQSLGFKVSVSTISTTAFMGFNQGIFRICDFITTNHYPSCGSRGLNSSVKDIADKIYSDIEPWYRYVRDRYPEKKIVIGEMGCQDTTESLLQPWVYTYTDNTTNDGKIQELFLEACFDGLRHVGLDEYFWWFQMVNPQRMKRVIENNTGGLI